MNTINIIIIATILGLFLLFIIIEYNKFTRLRNKVRQSKSSIDVYLNKRFDLIPNLVECVKAYSKHEENVFTEIAEKRSKYNLSKDLKLGKELNNEMINIIAVNENNPNLKASEQFINLQKNLIKIEEELQATRRIYNGDVTLYNSAIETFPSNLFAKIFKFKKEELFEIQEYKRKNVEVELND